MNFYLCENNFSEYKKIRRGKAKNNRIIFIYE